MSDQILWEDILFDKILFIEIWFVKIVICKAVLDKGLFAKHCFSDSGIPEMFVCMCLCFFIVSVFEASEAKAASRMHTSPCF